MDHMTDNRQDADFVFGQPRVTPKRDPQGGLVTAWSYSRLKNFEECPYRVFMSSVEKKKEAKSETADRGTSIHTLAENYVKGRSDLPPALSEFTSPFERLRAQFREGKVSLEGDWAFDIDWNPTGWFDDNVWGRFKLDAFVREDETSAIIIDYKTGKKFGNELPHSGQAQQYAVATFMRFPELEFLQTMFWYLDVKTNNIMQKTYTRERAMVFLPSVTERAVALTSAREFPAKPSKHNCRLCPHKDSCGWAEK